jgi:polysaccharide export outer membrane protein
MLATLPNRQSLDYKLEACDWPRLLARTARLATVFAALIGPAQRSWSQSDRSNADPGLSAMCGDLSNICELESQQSAVVSAMEPIFGPPLANTSHHSNTSVVPSQPAELRVAILAHEPAPPKPQPALAESKLDSAAQAEPIPAATAAGSSVPLTTSSYLPADPEGYCFRCGVQCPPCGCDSPGWEAARPIPWEVFAQGEYVGPARLAHVPVYRLRVDDQLAFVYRLSGQVAGQPYRLNVRDRVQVQSLSAREVVNREVIVEPDGTITLPLLGQVRAAGATLQELSQRLDEQYKTYVQDPRITVTPLEMNSNLQELRSSVDRRYGAGGQVSDARISPDGTVQLPAIGSVPAQGLTLEELEREIKARYAQIVEGLEVTPILTARAPRYVYVVGEVRLPGRFAMEGPTTLMQAIALAGSWNVGAQLNEVIVFRRDENWQLMATKVNVRSSLLFKKPCPAGEIWLRDSDIVLVPKSPILCADDVINLVFTRGIYGVFPMTASLNFAKASSL